MSVYFIAVIQNVRDANSQSEYARRVIPHLMTTEASLLATALVTTGECGRIYELNPHLQKQGMKTLETIEGDAADGISLIKFPTRKAFEDWYNSEEYQQALPYRQNGADCQVFVVEGND